MKIDNVFSSKIFLILTMTLLATLLAKAEPMLRGDPTRPPEEFIGNLDPDFIEDSDADTLLLQSIFFNKFNKKAIINNILVKEGDMVLDKKVIKIEADYVALQDKSGKVSRLNWEYKIKEAKDSKIE